MHCSGLRKLASIAGCAVLLSQAVYAEAPKTVMELRDFAWREGGLRESHFGDREIIESQDVIVLEAPGRAEDGTKVPIKIKAGIPQTEERYIKTITLLIDANPVPFAGRFNFTPKSGRADLVMRVRVNDYTAMRAIAETNDGQLYMSSRFVKAAGGCSAPPPPDLEAAMARLGKMNIRTSKETSPKAIPAMLKISHPNVTGLQMDRLTRQYLPAHFVKEVKVTFDGELVMTAETDISISENPSLGFYFVPDRNGELPAEITDSQGMTFTQVRSIGSNH